MDAGLSGKNLNRPGLQAALIACAPGDALIVYSLSRLTRSTKDALAISEQLEQAGVDLISLNERIDTTTPFGKAFYPPVPPPPHREPFIRAVHPS